MKKIGKAGRRVLALLLTAALLLPGGIVASAADTEVTVSTAAGQIKVKVPAAGDNKLVVTYPESAQYDVTYNGTDYEQVIDKDMNIHTPLVDTQVTVSFKIVSKQNAKSYSFGEATLTVPGKETPAAGDNAAPAVLPELREWKGGSGYFTVKENGRIVIKDEALKDVAEELAADYQALTGKTLTVAVGSADSAQTGEFYFELTEDTSLGLMDEGYLMDIGDKVTVQAETTTGAYWATRTILQSIKQTGNIPQGKTRDYPLYKVRGFILDVGRKTFTLDYLKQVVKEMAWYKMNDFHVHLNDNLISLEHYTTEEEIMNAYSGFRLESDIKKGGNNGLNQADLTSTDVFYTKDEFRSFIKDSRMRGVNIVPEIDVPAHSLALTKVRPDLRHGTNGRNNDHLALASKYEECVDFVQSIFDEYMGKDLADPVFDEMTTVHIGADEYTADGDAYRRFADEMLNYIKDSGRTPRIWGSLSTIRGTQGINVVSEGVQMDLWNYNYAMIGEMYGLGYDLINCNDGNYYVVPNAGYYYDYLSDDTLYNLAINSIGGTTIPAGDKQMIGGAFAVWNDMTDYLDNGVSEYDVYDRIENAIPLFGAKLWGKGSLTLAQANERNDQLGSAPGNNFGYEVASTDASGAIVNYPMDDEKDLSANSYNLKLDEANNASLVSVDGRKALQLKGGESYVETPLTTAGLGNDLRVKVKRTGNSQDEQILFESSYGAIKAVQKGTGRVGISRENFDYSFNYELPVDEWIELEFKNQFKQISLYVNGELVDTLGDGEEVEGRPLLATNMFPIEKIGSATNAFVGYVDDVRLGTAKNFSSTMRLDYAEILAKEMPGEEENAELSKLAAQAAEIFRKYDPTAQEIESLAAQIEAEMAKGNYEKADYSRVDKYKSVYEKLKEMDITRFTEESAIVVERAVATVREDLPDSMQSTVDGYQKMIENALDGLQLKEIKNVNYIDNEKLTATASSYQQGSGEPENALDDDESSVWHSNWNKNQASDLPHWIDIKISEPTEVNGLTYVTRKTGANGNLGKYDIKVSSSGKNYATDPNSYTSVKTGDLKGASGTYELLFDTKTVTNVCLVYNSGASNFGSAAEIKLHRAYVEPDTQGLKTLSDAAAALERGETNGFTEETWNALQTEITTAQTLAAQAGVDAYDVEIEKSQLAGKIAELRIGANMENLQERYDKYARRLTEAGYAEHYTEESWNAYTEAMNAAAALLENKDTRQADVDIMKDNLLAAHKALQPKESADAFKDVTEAWMVSHVENAYQQKLMTGKNSTSFEPVTPINRAEVAVVVNRMAGSPKAKNESTFTDLTQDWYKNAVNWANGAQKEGMEKPIITGSTATQFRPADPISRQEMAMMLYRYAQYMGYDTSTKEDPNAAVHWADIYDENDKPWASAETALKWCVAKGLITGNNGTLDPFGTTYRVQAAAIFSRFAEQFEN